MRSQYTVERMWLQIWIQKGGCGVKASEIVLASWMSISTLILGRLIPPLDRSREAISSLGWYCLPFQTNWLVSVCSWVITLCGAGDTDAWYQKSEGMKVLRTSTLPLSDRLQEESELALALAF